MMPTDLPARNAPAEPAVRLPAALGEALDPTWLTDALAGVSNGRKVTRRVDPTFAHQFVDRLGRAVMRHNSHALLGIV